MRSIIHSVAEEPVPWRAERNGVTVCGLGSVALLQGPLTAFFASRQCPGTAIRAATGWALQQAQAGGVVIGGFHSPLEQSVLRLLLEAGSSVVVALARPVAGASLGSAWRAAMDASRMAVISRAASVRRLTEEAAADRNELAARLADRIVVAHASPGGCLSRQRHVWLNDQLDVRAIGDSGEFR